MGFMQINGISYDVPQEFDLINAIDEHSETYRISLGSVNPTDEDNNKYKILFAAIDARTCGVFLTTPVIFAEGAYLLKMSLATVDVYKKPYGTFYEIESGIKDTKIEVIKEGNNDYNRRASAAKGEKINRKRKVTS